MSDLAIVIIDGIVCATFTIAWCVYIITPLSLKTNKWLREKISEDIWLDRVFGPEKGK